MKCISCGAELANPTDRLCPACSAKMADIVNKQKAAAEAQAPQEPPAAPHSSTESMQQASPSPTPSTAKKPVTPQAPAVNPNQPIRMQTSPKSQKVLRERTKKIKMAPQANTDVNRAYTPAPPRKHLNPMFTVAGISFVILIILGGLIGIYPYVEAAPIVKGIDAKLPETEQAMTKTILSVQKSSEFEIDSMRDNNQVGAIKIFSQDIAARIPKTLKEDDTFSVVFSGDVAGTSVGTQFAYDSTIQQYEDLTDNSEHLLKQAKLAHEDLAKIQNYSSNLWIADSVSDHLREVLATEEKLLTETEAIIDFQKFNIKLNKRMDDIGAGLQIAFLSDNPDLIASALSASAKDLKKLQQDFTLLPKPEGSEEIVEDTNESLKLVTKLFEQMNEAFTQRNLSKLTAVTNQFLVDAARFSNSSADKTKRFWKNLPLGDIFKQWQNKKDSLIQEVQDIENNPIYGLTSGS